MVWIDSTSYSRSDSERMPRMWTAKTEYLSITVMNRHRDYPGEWRLTCHEVGMETRQINLPIETSPELVQAKAEQLVKNRLKVMLDSIV